MGAQVPLGDRLKVTAALPGNGEGRSVVSLAGRPGYGT